MKTIKIVSAIYFVSVLFFWSCTKPTPNTDYMSAANCTVLIDSLNTYTHSVKAIFNSHCAYSPCHDANTAKKKVILDSYAGSVAAVNKFPTKFLCSIHQDAGTVAMPKGAPKLADSLILKIDCWVKNGMQE